MNVFGYVRVSSTGQAKDGYSLSAQRKAITEFCKKEGFSLIETLDDKGISGTDGKISERKGLLTMLSRLSEVQAIVVMNTSRLWRDDLAKALIKRELLNHKVEVISIEQPNYKLNSVDPSEFLVNGMLELLDQFTKMQLVLTMSKGRLEKLSKGGFPGGGVALGYVTRDSELQIDLQEKAIIDLIISLRKQGCGFHKIARTLNARGIKGKRGGTFGRTTIRKIVTNPIYIGQLTYGAHKVKGKHTPLLSKVSFVRANGARKTLERPLE